MLCDPKSRPHGAWESDPIDHLHDEREIPRLAVPTKSISEAGLLRPVGGRASFLPPLLSRLLIIVVVFVFTGPILGTGQWNVGGAASPLNGFARWDSAYYLNIGYQGYISASTYAFRPIFPAIMWVLSVVGGSSVGWVSETMFGFVWNLIATLAAFYLLHRLTRFLFPGTKAAGLTTALLAFSPASFFLTTVYPEATTLLLIVATIFFLEKHSLGAATVCGFLVGLTRPEGFLIFIPFLLKWVASKNLKFLFSSFLVLSSFPIFLLYAYARTGNALLPITAEQHWVKSTILDLLSGNVGFTTVAPTINNVAVLLNIITVVIASASLIHAYRTQNVTKRLLPYYSWAACLIVFVLLVGEVHSWARFTLVLLPIYWSQALTLEHSRFLWVLLSTYAVMLIAGTALFASWYPML